MELLKLNFQQIQERGLAKNCHSRLHFLMKYRIIWAGGLQYIYQHSLFVNVGM